MNDETPNVQPPPQGARLGGLKIVAIVVVATVIATLAAVWAVTTYLFPSEFKPVTLSAKEERTLDAKLERLDSFEKGPSSRREPPQSAGEAPLEPEAYSEEGADREIVLSEKELNALLAKNTDLATKLAIDLADDLASAKLLVPLDEEFPFLGGKTLKVTAGLQLAYAEGRPVVALRGVSVWGVPLPNAWLGNLKNVDLVKEFGGGEGFWSAFAAGIDEIAIEEGSLRVRLKE
ncbi:hypothetical protein [uncultured Desulfuromonas sp.]|uniref:hypothetical protein n=1 Tax=uncultured Desulfuromonas sp. TaxID=181013 RepID=UPI00260623F3|nr:hypothetical protein [uncultured Desulfuromonas sp.]